MGSSPKTSFGGSAIKARLQQAFSKILNNRKEQQDNISFEQIR